MSESTVEDVVSRVEQAPLSELVQVSIDDVQTQMDSYLDTRVDPASLYRRWERQQWAVQDVDLSVDVQQWSALPDGVRRVVRRIMTLFYIGEQEVTDTLAPVMHSAPRSDERVFLATQLADEARHTVFFQRFFDEVLEVPGGLPAALETVGEGDTAVLRRIFEDQLHPAIDRVRLVPEDMVAWAEAVVTYHLVVEGYLAQTGQRNVLGFTRATGFMPGFHSGFTAVMRDESRHVGFGVLALRRRVQEDPEIARAIALKLIALAEPAVTTAADPSFIIQGPPPSGEEGGGNGDRAAAEAAYAQAREYAQGQLTKRLRAIGLSDAAIADVRSAYAAQYDRQWQLFGT